MPEYDSLHIKITGDARDFERSTRKAEKSAAGLEKKLAGIFSRYSNRRVNVDVTAGGVAETAAALKGVDAAADRLDGRDVTIDLNADRKGLDSLKSGFGELAGSIRNTGTILQASKIPFMLAGIGGAVPTIAAAAASAGGLAISLGRASAGFALVGGAAGGGALIGLKAYTAGIQSTISASREAYEATNEARMELLEERRQKILSTKASLAFNREIDRSSIILTKLQAAIGNKSFPLFTRELSAWNTELVSMTPKLSGAAGNVSMLAAGFSEWFRTADNGKVLNRTLNFILDSAYSGGVVLYNLGRTGVMAFQPLIPLARSLQEEVGELTGAAAKWAESAEGQSRIGEVYRSLWTDAKRLGGAVWNLGRGVVGVFDAIDESGLDDQALGGLERLATGFARATSEGSKARQTLNGFLTNARELMPFATGAVGAFAGQFGRVANVLIRTRAEGSKLTVLQETFRGLEASARPLGNLLISTFTALGPEIPKLVINLSRLAETFAGSTGPLVVYVRVLNRAMGIFNSLPGPVKTLVANLIGLKMIMGTMGFGGLISGAVQLLINYRLLAGQSKILKVQQAGVAVSNTAVAGTSNAAAGAMSRMAVAGRALRTVMATLVLPVAAVIALGGAFVYAYRHSRTFRDAVDGLGKKLIGTSNAATISKRGFAGLGKVLMDNKGASAAWSNGLEGLKKKLTDAQGASGSLRRVLSGVRANLTDARGASVLWRDGLSGLIAKITDTRGASGGLRSTLAGLKRNILDNRGASVLWSQGLTGVGRKITDTEGASGKLRQMLGGLLERVRDNRGASASWADGLPSLISRLSDTKGASGQLRDVLGNLKGRFADNRGASNLWASTLPSLRDKLSGVGDESGVLRSTLGNLKDRFADVAKSGENRFKQLREAAGRSFGNFLEDSVMFGKSLGINMNEAFGKGINTARDWLGGLMYAASRVLSAIGADEMAAKAKGISEDLKEPLKMARGGMVNADRGGVGDGKRILAITNEAGGPEAVTRLDKRTPESDRAVQAITRSPAYGPAFSGAHGMTYMARGGILGPGHRGGGDSGSPSGSPANRYSGAGKYGIAGSTLTTPYGGSSGFGVHYAIDVAAPEGTPIKAVYPGYNYAAPSGDTPYNVWTDYGGLGAHYGHNSAIGKTGPVNAGDTIAYIGSRGNVTGPHAHISVAETFADATKGMWDGIDPENLFGDFYIPGGKYTGPGNGGSGVLSSIASSFRDASKWLKEKANEYMSSFASMIPGFPDLGLGWIGEGMKNGLTGDLVSRASDWIFQKATEKFSAVMPGGGGDYSGAMPTGKIRDWIVSGFNLSDAAEPTNENLKKFYALGKTESDWIPTAVQKIYDINNTLAGAGGFSDNLARGALQVTPQTWEGVRRMYGKDLGIANPNIFDPVKNVAARARNQMANLGYISDQPGYRLGGVIPGRPGESVMVEAHAGERVISEETNRGFEALANSVEIWSRHSARSGATVGSAEIGGGSIERAVRDQTEALEARMEEQIAKMLDPDTLIRMAEAYHGSPGGKKKQSENMAHEINALAGTRPESK